MRRILLIPFLFIAFVMSAAPIGEKRAREIAEKFFAEAATKAGNASLVLEWAGNDMDGAVLTKSAQGDIDRAFLYIYNREGNNGFVVIAGDDNVKPILAFSYSGSFELNNMPDGARYILSGWCKQVQAARNSTVTKVATKSGSSVGNIICEYQTALWGQREPYNREAPVINESRCVTGCVATAMSILAYYHKFPERGIGTIGTYHPEYEDGPHTLGRTYDYNNMLPSYHDENGQPLAYTDEQGNNVAALMYDMGRSVTMSYGPQESLAMFSSIPNALITHFSYSKSALLIQGQSYPYEEWVNMLQQNLAEYGPTLFSGRNNSEGHTMILDGCTDAGYFRFNYGWDGWANGYYLLPEQQFAYNQDAIFYLEPDSEGTSTYQDMINLNSNSGVNGIETDVVGEFAKCQQFNLRMGSAVNKGVTKFTGDVAIALCSANGSVKQILHTFSNCEINCNYGIYSDAAIPVTITENLAEGDRIRVVYDGAYSDGWQWARRYSEGVVDEIIVYASPDDIAESLGISYVKETQTLTFVSAIPVVYSVKDSSSNEKTSGNAAAKQSINIDMQAYAAGTYTFSFKSGGNPYVLTIIK